MWGERSVSNKSENRYKIQATQTKIMVSHFLLLFSPGMYFGAKWFFVLCKFSAYLRHDFGLECCSIHCNTWHYMKIHSLKLLYKDSILQV